MDNDGTVAEEDRPMAISEDWLIRPITRAEVEEELAELGAPDLWLRQWRQILDRLVPGDELWEYFAEEYETPRAELAEEIRGFEQIRGTEFLDWIEKEASEPTDRIVGWRAGYALVRGHQILDWIEDTR
jgi:hypothetical protein